MEGPLTNDKNLIMKEDLRVTYFFFNFLKFDFQQFNTCMHIDIKLYMHIYVYIMYSDFCHPSSLVSFHPTTHSLTSLLTEFNWAFLVIMGLELSIAAPLSHKWT